MPKRVHESDNDIFDREIFGRVSGVTARAFSRHGQFGIGVSSERTPGLMQRAKYGLVISSMRLALALPLLLQYLIRAC